MSGIDLSRSPYFDDFDSNNNYYKVLFRPSVAVQTREVNQLQSVLQDQIAKFGRNIFKDGSVSEGCAFSFDKNYSFVKVKDNYSNGTAFIITDFQDMYVVNQNGLEAVIVNTVPGYEAQDPDVNTLYIKYLNSATFSNGVQQSVFSDSEEISITTVDGIVIGNVNVFSSNVDVSTGQGYAFTTGAGVIYKNGYFVNVKPQTIIVNKYNNYPDGISVGFSAVENIITPEANSSLLDNSLGSPNYSAPGAHRYQVIPTLVTMQTNNITNSTPFFSLCDFQSGRPISIKNDPQYNIIGAEMARRTFETNGDYIVNPFVLTTESQVNGDVLVSAYNNLICSRGLAYIKGYRNEFLNNVTVPIRKATNYQSACSTIITLSYGNFVTVDEYVGDFRNSNLAEVELHNVAKQAISNNNFLGCSYSTSTRIGTAYLRGFSYAGGQIGTGTDFYDAYLFDIQMNAGHSFSEVESIIRYSGSVKAVADVIPILTVTNTSTIVVTTTNTQSIPVTTHQIVHTVNSQMVPITTTVTNTVVTWGLQQIPPLPALLTDVEGALLPNGNIITVGGYNVDTVGTNLVFSYSPNNNVWTTLPSFPQSVGLTGVTPLSNGSIIAGGGTPSITSGCNAVPYFYRYDPGANAWTQIASMPIRICNYGLVTLGNGSVLSVGGWLSLTPLQTANCYRYDPGANTWTQVAPLPQVLGGMGCATLANGSVLSVAGSSTNACYRYDPSGGTWTQVANYPLSDGNLTAARLANGNVLGIGGVNVGESLIANCYEYDPAANSWTQTGTLPLGLAENGVAPFSNGNCLTLAGQYNNWSNTTYTQNCYMYDCGSSSWSTTVKVPTLVSISNVVVTLTQVNTDVYTDVTNTTYISVNTDVFTNELVTTTTTTSGLSQSFYNKMIFPTGQKAIKLDGFNNQSYIYRTSSNSTFSNLVSGGMSISLGAPVGSATETFDFGGYLSGIAETNFIVIPTGGGATSNKSGTVGITSGDVNVVGSGTSFLTDYSGGDYITVNGKTNQINTITSQTAMTLKTNYGSPSAVANVHYKSFPAGVPIDFTRSNRLIFISSNTATFTIGEALNGAFNATVYYDIRRSNAMPIKKKITRNVYVAINCASHSSGIFGPWSLGFVDILGINAIYVNEGSFSNTGPDSSSQFQIDIGQRDDHYECASLMPSADFLDINSMILVDLDMYTYDLSQGVGFFNANSYPVDDINVSNTNAIMTQYIPQYMSIDGSVFDLRDCVDFRPFAFNTANSLANSINWTTSATVNPSSDLIFYTNPTYGSFIPSPDSNYITDLQFYLPRKDKIILTSGGQLKNIEGSPSAKPIAPLDLPDAMTLGIMDVTPYPSLATPDAKLANRYDYALSITITQHKRFTMKDIGDLSNKIDQLEYYTSLNLLEQSASTMLVRSSVTGQNRFQNGILVDPFAGSDIADTLDPTYNIAIDAANTELRPAFSLYTKSVWTDNADMPFDESDYIFQGHTSMTINCVSGTVTNWGRISFPPSCTPVVPDYYNPPDVVTDLPRKSTWINVPCRPTPCDTAPPLPNPLENTTVQLILSKMRDAVLYPMSVIGGAPPSAALQDDRTPQGMNWGVWRNYDTSSLSKANPKNPNGSGLTDDYGNVTTSFGVRNLVGRQQKASFDLANIGTSMDIDNNTTQYTNDVGLITDTSVIKYSASQHIPFVATGLKPNTKLNLFHGNYDVTDYARQCQPGFDPRTTNPYGSGIMSDNKGCVTGFYTIPPGVFKQGCQPVTLCDTSDYQVNADQITTRADGHFNTDYVGPDSNICDLDDADFWDESDIHSEPPTPQPCIPIATVPACNDDYTAKMNDRERYYQYSDYMLRQNPPIDISGTSTWTPDQGPPPPDASVYAQAYYAQNYGFTQIAQTQIPPRGVGSPGASAYGK